LSILLWLKDEKDELCFFDEDDDEVMLDVESPSNESRSMSMEANLWLKLPSAAFSKSEEPAMLARLSSSEALVDDEEDTFVDDEMEDELTFLEEDETALLLSLIEENDISGQIMEGKIETSFLDAIWPLVKLILQEETSHN